MEEAKIIAEFKDPLKGEKFCLALIPTKDLVVTEHQRKPSDFHIERLKRSMNLLGFTAPLICIKHKNKFMIIDGQHRFLAAKEMNAEFLPCIIVPERFSSYLIELNVEKTLTVREKSYVALQIYKKVLKEEPELKENSEKMQDLIESIYLATFGLAYEKNEKFVGSAFQSIAKRIDDPLDKPVKEAIKVREERARLLLKANEIMKEIAKALTEALGKFPPFLYQSIVSYANPIGKKRIVEESFEEVIEKLIEKLEEARKNPKVILERLGE